MAKKSTDQQRANSDGDKKRLANLKPFKPGQSGNPKGRPKSITLSEAYRRELAKPDPADEHGRTFAVLKLAGVQSRVDLVALAVLRVRLAILEVITPRRLRVNAC
jgi:hypothetical protein